jgi:hypothetical protein
MCVFVGLWSACTLFRFFRLRDKEYEKLSIEQRSTTSLVSGMNAKLILAEGLEVLRRGESKEVAADKLQEAIIKSSKLRRELPRLKGAYSHAYDTFIRGLELVNFVRRTAIAVGEHDLVRFCEVRMNHYMDRCEALRNKEANILLPIQLMSSGAAGGVKDGYEVKGCVGRLDADHGLNSKHPWKLSIDVLDGSYMIRVRNLDDYAIAAPSVVVELAVLGVKTPLHIKKAIPCQCGWIRYVGVVGKGLMHLSVSCDGVLRDSHVDVEVLRLEEVAKDDWMKTLPSIDDGLLTDTKGATKGRDGDVDDAIGGAQLPTFAPPQQPVYVLVNPAGVSLVNRLAQIRKLLDSWPAGNVAATKLDKGEQFILQAVHSLMIPTDLCGDMDLAGASFDVSAADMEGDRHD